MTFSKQDLEMACDMLATIPHFPRESRGAVMMQLAKMCPSRESLRWLTDQCVNKLSVWPGLAEIRGILCNRYDAADGIDGVSTLPGFSAADNESRYLAEHESRKDEGLAPASRQMLQELQSGMNKTLATRRKNA